MGKVNVCDAVYSLAAPIAEANGCEIYDVEFKKEGSDYYLRIFLDMKGREGSVSLNECEAVSRALSDELDKADPIEQAYMLEVSSAGLDRELKTEAHFKMFIGESVDIGLYKAVDGAKVISGILKGYDNGKITITKDNGEDFETDKKSCTWVKLSVVF